MTNAPVIVSLMLLTNRITLAPTDNIRATVITAVQITPNLLLSAYPDELTNKPTPAYFTNVVYVVTNIERAKITWEPVPEHVARNPLGLHETVGFTAEELKRMMPP